MKQQLFFFAFLFIFSCTSFHKAQKVDHNSSDLEFKILDRELIISKNYSGLIDNPENLNIKYSITNNSTKNYILVIDTSNFYIYSNTEWLDHWFKINNDDSDKQLLMLGLKIGNNEKYINTGYNLSNNYFENLPSLKSVVNNSIIVIKAGETFFNNANFTHPVILNKISNKALAQFFLLDDPEYFNIFLFQDKSLIINNLNKKNKEKIKKLNAEIYTGVLESNKIPIKLE